MSRKSWRRPIALVATVLATALGAACSAHTQQSPAPEQPAAAHAADTHSDSAGCGSGGAGGRGGDSGEGGEPGESGESGKPATHECTRYSDLPDKPKDELDVADKARVVLVLLNGGATKEQIAKKYKMPEHEVEAWKQAYLKGDWAVLMGNG
ncbi:hypothetical protein [Streptomyces olivochromogenes]|uniref:hypothetical protein n=1 Tax=Streptomyces olivochromogenes TaxID=1963 RepID=UPI001F2214BD|nr:hypothetical protein [Streptomyces olivochromogenes]MCF3136806.1 hypothetical protein [Streptomyces olivochromogenes]